MLLVAVIAPGCTRLQGAAGTAVPIPPWRQVAIGGIKTLWKAMGVLARPGFPYQVSDL
jgi:hypothetical protein